MQSPTGCLPLLLLALFLGFGPLGVMSPPPVTMEASQTPVPVAETNTGEAIEEWMVLFRDTDPEAWPWSVDSAILRCAPGNVVFVEFEDGTRVVINAPVRSARWNASNEHLREGKTPEDLVPMIEQGLELCP